MSETLTQELFDAPTRRQILAGAILMFVLNALLFWLPLLGPLIAGFVGGKVSGGIAEGVIAGAGGLWLALSNIGLLVAGAAIGGAFTD